MLLVQDCICVVAPYPFRIEPLEDFDSIGDLDVTGGVDVWYARIPREDPKGSCSGFKTRQRDCKQAVRTEHVDVALWKDVSSSNLCGSSCGIPQEEGAGIQGSWS
jgi:hypothetical protein